MCGIAGQVRHDERPIDPSVPDAMCARLEHRGPDARGIHIEDQAWIGIQRLRIIDLSTGDQPIYNEDGSVVVVLNGEIYNFQELRTRLRGRGHHFATASDTEVIVHLYEEDGIDCVRHLHGMFAFALWDRRERQLLLARDRVGKKPLLYALRDGGISFASEMGALLEDPEIARDVDPQALDEYLALGYVPAPRSVLRAVRKLPPAHTLVLRDGTSSLQHYWKLDYSTKIEGASTAEICERVRDELRKATRRRLISDVPLGAFLSGGIDSSAVVAAMAEQSPEPVRTFSIGFDHAAFDELEYARAIAQQFGTIHQEFRVQADAVEILPKIVRHHGEPFADSSAIPSFYLAEMTRRHVTVALNGDGGDESFGGYTRYVANAVAGRLDGIPASLRRVLGAAGSRLPERGGVSSQLNRARRLTATLALDGSERYARYMAWFSAGQRSALYTPEFAAFTGDGAEAFMRHVWARTSGSTVVDKMLEVDASTYLVDDLIAKIDIATMAHGLEARSPLLDHELMEFAATLPADMKVRGQQKKWILREAMRGWLPDDILDRPKQGFSVPLSMWLRTDLRAWSREILLDRETLGRGYFRGAAVQRLLDRHDAGSEGDAKRIWSLVMLELWHREFAGSASSAAPAVT